jgi:methionyl-tRNA formyltransferase
MRIVVIGQAAFGERVLARLLEKGCEVVGVSAPAGNPERPDPLAALAEQKGLPIFPTRELKKDDVYEAYAALEPDLTVMAFVTDILAERVLYTAKLGTIQYHPSILPRHRGASAMNWAVIQGDTTTGLTVFWPDKGIDSGPVLLQQEVGIGPDETMGALYFQKLFPMGVDAMAEAVALVEAGKAPKLVQDESQATYEAICTDEHGGIDWSKSAREVYNLIRGCNPQPGAHTTLRGELLKVFDCKAEFEPVQGQPGEVVELLDDAFRVVLNGGSLIVQRVQPAGSAKVKASEFLPLLGLKVGERLGD